MGASRQDRERFQRVAQLFEQVCNLPEEKRAAFLEEAGRDDAELRREVELLLERDSAALGQDKLEALEDNVRGLAAEAIAAQKAIPEHVGRYRILGELGRGGMGVVYRAEQDRPRRVVALKLIRPGAMSERMLRRFEHEADVLGRLHHPGIAQIFEAGTEASEDGALPFFAMELVDGRPLTTYAEEERLTIAQRVRLLQAICEALHHAHQKGVIHRDLKPANVLVTDAGEPKILDFGVARATDADLAITTLHTDARQLLGTIPYMSPEQVSEDPQELDIRSDVYSLGVVAYELLAGRLPYDVTGRTIPQAARVITEQEPRPLGTVNATLRGDLEIIIGKALEKERSRRYQSAQELASDLGKHLRHEPIDARPPSTLYQIRKFARRNSGLVTGLVVALVILLGALVGMGLLTLRAREAESEAKQRAQNEQTLRVAAEEARDAADRRDRVSRAVNQFLDRMLSAPDPWAVAYAGDLDVKVVAVLDQAATELDQSFDSLPDVEAEIRSTLGRTYQDLGYTQKARNQLRRAYELQRELHGERSREALTAMRALTEVLTNLGELREAEELARRMHRLHGEVLGPEELETLNAKFTLGQVLFELSMLEEAEELLREAYTLCLEVLGEEDRFTLRAIGNLAVVLLNLGRHDEAEALQREALDICLWLFDEKHPETLVVKSNLAGTLWSQDRRAEAEELAREVLVVRTEIFGEGHPSTLSAMNSLIVHLNARRATTEALELRKRQLEIARDKAGEDHPLTLTYKHNHASTLQKLGQLAEAEELCREVLEAQRRVYPPGHEQTLLSLEVLSVILQARRQREQAVEVMEEAVELAESCLAPGHWRRAWLEMQLGTCLKTAGRLAEAEPHLREGLDTLTEVFGVQHSRTRTAAKQLVQLYQMWGRPAEAAEVRAKALDPPAPTGGE